MLLALVLVFGRLNASHEWAGPVTLEDFKLVVVRVMPAYAQNTGVSLVVHLDFLICFGLFAGLVLGVKIDFIYD